CAASSRVGCDATGIHVRDKPAIHRRIAGGRVGGEARHATKRLPQTLGRRRIGHRRKPPPRRSDRARGWSCRSRRAGPAQALPGAVYDGNRFESRHIAYPPLLTEPADIGPNVPPIISDIPRLDVHGGSSRIDLLAGDVTTPAIGVWSARQGAALLLLTDQTTP